MKALILAAGYATRLYPLTLNKPKSLLPIHEETTVVDLIIEKLEEVETITEIYIVTNNKYFSVFEDWLSARAPKKPVRIINDGTNSAQDRLGAIGDIQFSIEQEHIDDDLLVLAGDNVFTFDLSRYIDFFYKTDRDCILVQKTDNTQELQSIGVVELDSNDRVITFEEKPEVPRTNIGVYALYIYKKTTLRLIKEYLDTGNNPDSPSRFPEWLVRYKEVMAYFGDGNVYDIGTHAAYEEVKGIFSELRD
jgi:glucose-1-phosphate thymidylyltransferase